MIILNQPVHISYFMMKVLLDLSRQALIKQENYTEPKICQTKQFLGSSNNIQQLGGKNVEN